MAEIPIRGPLVELTLARLREFWRDPGALFWTFGFPVVLAIALGLAFRSSPAPSERIGLVCQGDCAEWRTKLADGAGLTVHEGDLDAMLAKLHAGRLDLVLQIPAPPGPPGKGGAGDPREAPTLHFDPSRPEARSGRLAVQLSIAGAPTSLRLEEHTEPGSRYIDFLIPGLVGLNVMSSALWGVGFAVVEMRRRKLLKQLSATPMRRSHFLLSFMLSRLIFLVVEVVFLFGFGALAFDVPLLGNPLSILFIAVLGSLAFTGLGVLVASRPTSTEVASGWANFVMLPMWLLSGAFFSYERFPAWLHPTIQLLPLTALNDSLRAISNEGASLLTCAPQAAVLLGWMLLSFVAALRLFRWQ